ncbi:MAG: T9SS type A sorting domain-containing protein [Flavobacteriales bacterium]|nr:T9SS type A sorting domain-containing protein [Flavobacteriales bacterium]
MRLLSIILLSVSLQLKAQIIIEPYVTGEYRDDVVYIGTYQSPGNCSFNDGTDFTFDFSNLFLPDGMEFALIVDAPDPSNVSLMNGWLPVSVGDSTVFTSSSQGLGITAASGPATINFHIRAIGTPTTSGQEYPCWIDEGVTEALCGNIYSLYQGESLVPCLVAPSVGIDDVEIPTISIELNQLGLSITTDESGLVSAFGLDGRQLISKQVDTGFTFLTLASLATGTYVVRFEGEKNTISKKILLQ